MTRSTLVLLAAGLSACALGRLPGSPALGDDPCEILAPADARGGAPAEANRRGGGTRERDSATAADPVSIVVGIQGPVDLSQAPVPRNDAERLVFTHLYDTLVRITCHGRVEPRLASDWQDRDGGRRWTFTLRPDVSDWNGVMVTSTDVGSSWVAAQAALHVGGTDPARPRITAVRVGDARTLHVELSEPVSIGYFADPVLAVRTTQPEAGWPVGTGFFRPRVDGSSGTGRSREVSLTSVDGRARLTFRAITGDPRNALDAGMDLLVTRNPAVIDYSAALPEHLTIPLPWDRSYVLAVPDGPAAAATTVVRAPEAELEALARHAVPVDARPAAELELDLESCVGSTTGDEARRVSRGGGDPGVARSRRVVYPAGDPVARALAERLVALTMDGHRADATWIAEAAPRLAGTRPGVAGLPPARFAEALRAGGDAAYVLPLARSEGGECLAAGELLRRAPWLALAGEGDGAGSPSIVPLVETRSTLVVRRGIAGVAVDGSGNLILEGVRR